MSNNFAEQCVRHMLAQYRNESADFDFIRELEQATDMVFLANTTDTESLCYAHNTNLRAEYKTTFTTVDLWNYINNKPIPKSPDINAHLKTILPKTKQQFWKITQQNQQ
ncbi:hypothetical protein [Marinicella gelatinilytica]|uniref:hypothetical protein n=1 Tax=Marinicella gelatinilytica TaxID=2996017 RepID=UPI002260F58A|nr:hypothetical protein [Marinicella gelatinilytica]MCX7543904.1 hypothetical protein [Marinicella gelatinilytica]